MNNFPDFYELGYQVIRELGHNYAGGRITYLATDSRIQQSVVIKQFQFAKFSSDWSGFKAYEREIQVLQGLNHPGIPRYLDSFETPDGFCMVQEYKNAESLAVPRSFDADEIKQIAVSVLEILVYLQNRLPCVIHRDIKPENILVDAQLNVYLVDFGFARIGGGEVAMSSVALGTLGFMPPEQLYNRQLTEATDLYSLGMTLIGLLTRTKSTAIDTLIDEDNRVNFKHLVPKLSLRWIDWLEKLVQHNQKNRYPNAAAALEALKPIYVLRLPEANCSSSSLEFTAHKLGEKLTQTITVSNSAPGTVLEGTWEVAPHPSDPPHTPDDHAWISIKPAKFSGNAVDCKVTVDTQKLMAKNVYNRQILLHTNSDPETYPLTVKVQTAPLFKNKKIPYLSLTLLCGLSSCISLMVFGSFTMGRLSENLVYLLSVFGVPCGAVFGAMSGATAGALTTNTETIDWDKITNLALLGALTGVLIAAGALWGMELGASSEFGPLMIVFGAAVPLLGIILVRTIGSDMLRKGFSAQAVVEILVLTVGLGAILGLFYLVELSFPFVVPAILGTGLPLAIKILYPLLKQRKLIAKYRQSEQRLIKP
jgi:serine/threonine protein kinase